MTAKLFPCPECGAVGREPHDPSCSIGRRRSKAAKKGAKTKQGVTVKPKRKKATKKVARRRKRRIRNEIIFVVDRSTSMQGHWTQMQRNLKEQFAEITQDAIDQDQDAYVSFWSFGSNVRCHYVSTPVERARVPRLDCHGMTALKDGIAEGMNEFRHGPASDEDVAYLLVVITDGIENYSSMRTQHFINTINKARRSDLWTYAITGPVDRDWETTSR